MGKWKKAPQKNIDLFYEVLPAHTNIEPRKMFGYPCAFVNGNMFTGLHEDNFIARLSEEDREEAMKSGLKQFEPIKGRKMKEYIALTPEILKDKKKTEDFLNKAYIYASSLPKKVKKKKKAK